MPNARISELPEHSSPTGTEYIEAIISPYTPGTNRKILSNQIFVTREFNRAFSEEILFDKNEIDYATHTLTGDLEFTVAPSGNVANQFAIAIQTLVTDGSHTITFTGIQFVYGLENGTSITPDAGTYQVFYMYRNGVTTVQWPAPSSEVGTLITLAAPGSFTATPDGENEIDLAWTVVTNGSGFRIDFSGSSSGPWSQLGSDLGAGVTSASHTGLSPGSSVFYRIKALGDGVAFADSPYSTANASTENNADVTPPTFTFSPVDAATGIPINGEVIITASEPIRKVANTELTNANIADVLVVKEDNISGANIPFTATIDASKTIITITPNVIWGSFQNVFIQISGVEDLNDNAGATADINFDTSDYTLMTNDYLDFGAQLDSYLVGEDKEFKIKITVKNVVLSGMRTICAKYTASQHSFIYRTEGSDVVIRWYRTATISDIREIRWTGVLDNNEHILRLEWYGTIDTNNGLDRAALYIDGVLAGSKSLLAFGTLTWPFGIPSGTAPVICGHTLSESKDFAIEVSAVDVVQVIEIRTGIDTSGNSFDGTWTSF